MEEEEHMEPVVSPVTRKHMMATTANTAGVALQQSALALHVFLFLYLCFPELLVSSLR